MVFSFSAQKIQRRLSSLKVMPWFVEKKEIEKAVGSMDYTSSDESDWSEDENGKSRHSGFLVKKLPWEQTCLMMKPTCLGLTSGQGKISPSEGFIVCHLHEVSPLNL